MERADGVGQGCAHSVYSGSHAKAVQLHMAHAAAFVLAMLESAESLTAEWASGGGLPVLYSLQPVHTVCTTPRGSSLSSGGSLAASGSSSSHGLHAVISLSGCLIRQFDSDPDAETRPQ